MDIITITPNPAFDVHLECDGFKRGAYNKARLIRCDSGGKGVNLSRALHANSVDSTCCIMLGKEGADEFILPLYNIGMSIESTLIEGRVRENLNIHHDDTETVVATSGPAVGAAELADMQERLMPLVGKGSVVALCGSLAEGTDKEALLSVMHAFKRAGARIVVDSKSLGAEELLSLKPFLIKPNEEEAELLTGMRPRDLCDAARIAAAVRDMGCENVLLTMGGGGAALACAEGELIARVPSIEVRSTVGAGDSTIAGFLAAVTSGRSAAEALAVAMAYGAAACMEEGSLPPLPENVAKLESLISVESRG